MINRANVLELGKVVREFEDLDKELLGSLSDTLVLVSVIYTDNVFSDEWEYIPSAGIFYNKKYKRSISPILYKFRTTEFLEVPSFPFKQTAKDFLSDESFEDNGGDTIIVLPDDEFILNSREMASLVSKTEYDGICNAKGGKAYLDVRFMENSELPIWTLTCDSEQNFDCIYIDGEDKSKGLKEEYIPYLPQLNNNIEEIAKRQQIRKRVLDEDAADFAAYFRKYGRRDIYGE